ncbi:MAG: TIGR02453 family protein [Crocinitomix sp.]|nr:TIGR02453 family protein [Crocinitomix sp.]
MNYFSPDYLNFFKELAGNNHKDWFDVNRKRYETNVKKAFEVFITDLIAAIQKHDKKIEITYKEAIFRINRDVRFSKNKEPYKLNRSAIISSKGKKDKAFPGLYIELGPEHVRIYGGVFQPDKEQLYAIRETIVSNPKAFKKLVNDKTFLATFGEVRGDKNKIIPKEFKEEGERTPLIYNKQFYWFAQFEAEMIESEELLEKTMEVYLANKNIMDYFAKAMEI